MNAVHAGLETLVKPATKTKTDYTLESAPIRVNWEWCKGCDICSDLCPRNVLEPDRDGKPVVAHPKECTQCGVCWMHCPDLAITSNYR